MQVKMVHCTPPAQNGLPEMRPTGGGAPARVLPQGSFRLQGVSLLTQAPEVGRPFCAQVAF